MSISKDNSHSWVRISHGLNKLVTNLNNKEQDDNEQETSETKSDEFALKTNERAFASRSKGQSKTTKTRFCQLFHKNYTYWGKNMDRCWTRRIFNLRLWSVEEIDSTSSSWKSTQRKWWSDWILENRRQSLEAFLVISSLVWRFLYCHHWSDEKWKKSMAGRGTIRRSGINIKTRCIWVDVKLAQKKGFKFYQTRSNAIILHKSLPAYCIPKAVRMETEEIIYEKENESPRPHPKISFKDNWMTELDSEVARQPEGEVARQAKSSQLTKLTPNPNHDRTVRPVDCSERALRSQEIDTRFSH